MHTHDKLGFPQCKCMDCAAARQWRLRKEVLARRPEQYQALEIEVARAEQAVESATVMRDAAMRRRQEVLAEICEEIEKEILAEEGAKS